jgi:hypothetical protein
VFFVLRKFVVWAVEIECGCFWGFKRVDLKVGKLQFEDFMNRNLRVKKCKFGIFRIKIL